MTNVTRVRNKYFSPSGYTGGMNLALMARITFDPQRLRLDGWVHDTAHHLVSARRQALLALERAGLPHLR